MNQDLNSQEIFPDTYSGKKSKYNNKIIKGIYITSGSKKLTQASHNILMEDSVYSGYSGCSTAIVDFDANFN